MLYQRWRQIVQERAGECALRDLASGERWTFGELARRVEAAPAVERMVFPQGQGSGFVFSVLEGWRADRLVCPLEPGQEPPPPMALPPARWVHLKTTSATTGASRYVAFTAGQLAADVDNIVATMGLRPAWPNLAVISLAHSYGFSNLVLPLLLHGIPLFLAPSPLPETLRQAAEQAGAAGMTLPAVPVMWRAWQAAGAIPANVRLAISAGAPLPAALESEVYSATGIKIHNFYGSSECGGIAYDASSAPRRDETCAGRPLRNVELQIGPSGCLEVRSRAVGETYWPKPSGDVASGCFKSSDLAELIDGQVCLRGRLADQINVAGRKVAPAAIERALLGHERVADCLAFGVPSPDASRAEAIVACVVAKAPVTGEELKQFLLGTMPAWQIPREWWFVDSLGENHRGKVSREHWRKAFLEKRNPGT